ncbi:MAG TPA: 50S ribosomal protein L25, partial [Gammaproteobacteria bacterium]|nr:50S ribosomal protein L25 [Gammaproteobacteria bacterium]
RNLEHEAFYSHVLTIKVGKGAHQAILKDIQRHPAKRDVLHLDLQRVKAGEQSRVHVPLHFINEDTAPGVKAGGALSRHMIDLDIECIPSKLPEYIEIDLGALEIGDSIHLSEIKVPEGVTIVALSHGEEQDRQVASVHHVRVSEEPTEEVPEEEPAVEVEAKGKEKGEGDSEGNA